jgi:hypothetical protein
MAACLNLLMRGPPVFGSPAVFETFPIAAGSQADLDRRRCHELSYSMSAASSGAFHPMSDPQPIQGDVQSQVISVMWRLES